MPTFAYTVRDSAGQIKQGTLEGENDKIVARRLREQGFQVASVKRTRAAKKTGAAAKGGGGFSFGRVKLRDLSIFCRQFSTMVDAGVSLVRCLNVLAEQSPSPKLRRIIIDLQAEVEAGNTLSRALQKYPRVFSKLFIGLVRAGGVRGRRRSGREAPAPVDVPREGRRTAPEGEVGDDLPGHRPLRRPLYRPRPGDLHPAEVHGPLQGPRREGVPLADDAADELQPCPVRLLGAGALDR